MGMNPRVNFDGYINERGGDKNNGYTQLFSRPCKKPRNEFSPWRKSEICSRAVHGIPQKSLCKVAKSEGNANEPRRLFPRAAGTHDRSNLNFA